MSDTTAEIDTLRSIKKATIEFLRWRGWMMYEEATAVRARIREFAERVSEITSMDLEEYT